VTGIADGGSVSGTVEVEARVEGATLRRVEVWIDGRRRVVDRNSPYTYTWDTSRERAGAHEVVIRAVTSNGRVLTFQAAVTVTAA
jgi:hypothetical protein